jgi:hypothetical protein
MMRISDSEPILIFSFFVCKLSRLSRCLTFSGGKRIRTADFLRAKQALYQLSYTP